jgi:hypothetical protein
VSEFGLHYINRRNLPDNLGIGHKDSALESGPIGPLKKLGPYSGLTNLARLFAGLLKDRTQFKKKVFQTRSLSNLALFNPYPTLSLIFYIILIILLKFQKQKKMSKTKKYNVIFLYKYKLILKKYIIIIYICIKLLPVNPYPALGVRRAW